ncbi:MAG: hypothetical protein PHO48_04120 [Candidatus Gracilibacteria bacterium]|nr:hypothetical protein [Candidatus Gracilibacteria bacterium]
MLFNQFPPLGKKITALLVVLLSVVSFQITTAASSKPTITIVGEKSATLGVDLTPATAAANNFFSSSAGFITGDFVLIGNELIQIQNLTAKNVGKLTRGISLNGITTEAANHKAGEKIRNLKQIFQLSFATESYTLKAGDKVVVIIPAEFTNFAKLTAADITTAVTGEGSFNPTESFDTRTQTITFTVAKDFSAAGENITLTFGKYNQLLLPPLPGNYAFSFSVKTAEDKTMEKGFALLASGSEIVLRATIAEALILSVDKSSLSFKINSSKNGGKDFSQKSLLTVKTNARNGYKIQALFSGAENTSAAQLDATDFGNTAFILSGDALTTPNRFGYIAYNSEATKNQQQLEKEAVAAQTFFAIPTTLQLYDNSGEIGYPSVTNSHLHTVFYAINTDVSTPAGEYGGSITYIALPTF